MKSIIESLHSARAIAAAKVDQTFAALFLKLKPFPQMESRPLLAINVGDQEIKGALIALNRSKKRESTKLMRFSLRDHTDDEVAAKIQSTMTETKAKDVKLIGVVSSRWVITRTIEIPSLIPHEIREIVNLQASRHTPYSRSEIIADYLNLGVFKRIYTKILLVILPRAALKRYYDFADKLHLGIEKICFSPEAISRSYSKRLRLDSEPQPVCVVHVDLEFSEFMILFKGILLFVRSMPIGSQHLHEDIMGQSVSFVEEMKKSLELYQSENIDQAATKLILTGAVQGLESLEAMILDTLRLSVRRVTQEEALSNLTTITAETSQPASSYLDVATTPLLSKDLVIDLTPEEAKLKRTLDERSEEIVKTGFLAVVFLGLICAISIGHLYFRKAIISQMSKRFEPIKKEAQQLEEVFNKVKAIRTYLDSRGKSIDTLAEIYKLIPSDTMLTNIGYDEDSKFSMKGSSQSRTSIFAFVGDLEKSGLFQNVQAKYVTNRKEEGREFSDFEIVALFEH